MRARRGWGRWAWWLAWGSLACGEAPPPDGPSVEAAIERARRRAEAIAARADDDAAGTAPVEPDGAAGSTSGRDGAASRSGTPLDADADADRLRDEHHQALREDRLRIDRELEALDGRVDREWEEAEASIRARRGEIERALDLRMQAELE